MDEVLRIATDEMEFERAGRCERGETGFFGEVGIGWPLVGERGLLEGAGDARTRDWVGDSGSLESTSLPNPGSSGRRQV